MWESALLRIVSWWTSSSFRASNSKYSYIGVGALKETEGQSWINSNKRDVKSEPNIVSFHRFYKRKINAKYSNLIKIIKR